MFESVQLMKQRTVAWLISKHEYARSRLLKHWVLNCPYTHNFSNCLTTAFKNQFREKQVLTHNPFPNKPLFLCVCSTSLENTVGKGEIARNEQFLLFP